MDIKALSESLREMENNFGESDLDRESESQTDRERGHLISVRQTDGGTTEETPVTLSVAWCSIRPGS